MQRNYRTELPLIAPEQPGCSCCSPPARTGSAAEGTERYSLEGFTCRHCVETVETAISKVDGIQGASVELVPGGTSQLTVFGTAAEAAVRDAVAAAGYRLGASSR